MTASEGYAESGSGWIFYESIGEGRPILFAHAGVADRQMWDAQFADPIPGHRYIRSDMRGYGKSEWTAEGYTPTTDFEAVIDHLGLTDSLVVGCSMGGRIALELAIRRPEGIGGIVVIGTGLPGWQPEDGGYTPPQWADDVLDPLWKNEDWDALAEIDAEVWLLGVGRDRSEVDLEIYRRFLEMDRKPLKTELERDDYAEWAVPDLAERIDEIDVPTLVMVGEHDLPDIVTSTALLADRISDRSRALITEAAHLASMERPDQFDAIFRPWVEELSTSG